MTGHDIDQLLRSSAPAGVGDEPAVRARIDALNAEARAAARPARRIRRLAWVAVPALLAPTIAFALTGGGDPRMVPDYTIPISYTTDAGNSYSCSIFLFNGEINYVETSFVGVDYLTAQDWTGIGQRIYDAAVARIDAHDPVVFAADSLTGAHPTQEQVEQWAWSLAEGELVKVPDEILKPGDHWGSDSDCTGALR